MLFRTPPVYPPHRWTKLRWTPLDNQKFFASFFTKKKLFLHRTPRIHPKPPHNRPRPNALTLTGNCRTARSQSGAFNAESDRYNRPYPSLIVPVPDRGSGRKAGTGTAHRRRTAMFHSGARPRPASRLTLPRVASRSQNLPHHRQQRAMPPRPQDSV